MVIMIRSLLLNNQYFFWNTVYLLIGPIVQSFVDLALLLVTTMVTSTTVSIPGLKAGLISISSGVEILTTTVTGGAYFVYLIYLII